MIKHCSNQGCRNTSAASAVLTATFTFWQPLLACWLGQRPSQQKIYAFSQPLLVPADSHFSLFCSPGLWPAFLAIGPAPKASGSFFGFWTGFKSLLLAFLGTRAALKTSDWLLGVLDQLQRPLAGFFGYWTSSGWVFWLPDWL